MAPGQNAAARRVAALLRCPAARAASAEEKWLISGLNCGLCFAENMRATADALVATAPAHKQSQSERLQVPRPADNQQPASDFCY